MVEVVGRRFQVPGGLLGGPDGFAANCKGQGCASDLPHVVRLVNGHHRSAPAY